MQYSGRFWLPEGDVVPFGYLCTKMIVLCYLHYLAAFMMNLSEAKRTMPPTPSQFAQYYLVFNIFYHIEHKII
jgi:hypothetical protein